jgi:excinuclease UvrABC nuclease subunit
MIGIYKITNLINKRIYIGQSSDILKRFKQYHKLQNCKTQTLFLINSKKYITVLFALFYFYYLLICITIYYKLLCKYQNLF